MLTIYTIIYPGHSGSISTIAFHKESDAVLYCQAYNASCNDKEYHITYFPSTVYESIEQQRVHEEFMDFQNRRSQKWTTQSS